MVKITVIPNVLDASKNETVHVHNVADFLMQRFPTWHSGLKIYNADFDRVSFQSDVTPNNEREIDRLQELKGPLTVIEYPGDFGITEIIAIALILAVVAATYFLMPKQPSNAASPKQPPSSPNNSLSTRSNQARLGGRIADIYGEVFCIPDLLQLPYRVFKNNLEYEYSYMCIGRGEYQIFAANVLDGDTPISGIVGSAAAFYGPDTSPNSGDAPILQIGDNINTPLINIRRSNSVDGQELLPPNYKYWSSSANGYFAAPDDFKQYEGGPLLDALTRYFDSNDTIDITSTTYDNGSGVTANLTGQGYTIQPGGVARDAIGFHRPYDINPDWNNLQYFASGETDHIHSVTLDGTQGQHGPQGPYIVGIPQLSGLIFNFVQPGGAFEVNTTDGTYSAVDIQLEIKITPCEQDGTAAGPVQTYPYTIYGSASIIGQRGVTYKLPITSVTDYVKVSVERLTDRDFRDLHTPTDQTIWRDLYMYSNNLPDAYGNVTTVQTVTKATSQAAALKQRKFAIRNCIRKIPIRIGNTNTFTSTLYPRKSADEILCAVALDPYIGNRNVSELDLDNIYDTVAEVEAYFGLDACAQFSYTFDDPDITFENTWAAISNAIFCTGYRQGSQFKLSFERQTNDSKQLFNHRNKVPKSEQRAVHFGKINNFDGVILTYVDPDNNDLPATIVLPSDGSAINPNQVSTVGVRDHVQAYMLANRIKNKQDYQHISTQFTALHQADLLIRTDRILVTDDTRPDVRDGDVLDQNGLILTLSQSATIVPNSDVIFLQHYDETVESIVIAAQPAANQITLKQAPRLPLSLDPNNWSKTAYEIVSAAKGSPRPFLVSNKSPKDKATSDVSAINYDDRYYANDTDYVNGIIDGGAFVIPPGDDLGNQVIFW